MSFKKSVGWANISCNPIKGRCMGNCWYCFYSGKGKMLDRFKHDPAIRLQLSVFDTLPKKVSKRVFLCSTHDLFGSWISENWRDLIFDQIEKLPQHTFQILTKFPENIDREMPDNVWLGCTVTEPADMIKSWRLSKARSRIRFISFEPLLEEIDPYMIHRYCNWVIIGKLTGFGNKHDPHKEWIDAIIRKARGRQIPIFLKDNLKDIWGDDLIQEFPQGK